MAIPDFSELQPMDYAFEGGPFVEGDVNDSIDSQTMDYAFEGGPFVGNPGEQTEAVIEREETIDLEDSSILHITYYVDEGLELGEDAPMFRHTIDEGVDLSDTDQLNIVQYAEEDIEIDEFWDLGRAEIYEELPLSDDEVLSHIVQYNEELVELSEEVQVIEGNFQTRTETIDLEDSSITHITYYISEGLELSDESEAITGFDETDTIRISIPHPLLDVDTIKNQIRETISITDSMVANVQEVNLVSVTSASSVDNPFKPTVIVKNVYLASNPSTTPAGDVSETTVFIALASGGFGSNNITGFSFSLDYNGGSFSVETEEKLGNLGQSINIFGFQATITGLGQSVTNTGGKRYQTSGSIGVAQLHKPLNMVLFGSPAYNPLLSSQTADFSQQDTWTTVADAARAIAGVLGIDLQWLAQDVPLSDFSPQSGMTALAALSSLAGQVGATLRWNGNNSYSVAYPFSPAPVDFLVPSGYLLNSSGIAYKELLNVAEVANDLANNLNNISLAAGGSGGAEVSIGPNNLGFPGPAGTDLTPTDLSGSPTLDTPPDGVATGGGSASLDPPGFNALTEDRGLGGLGGVGSQSTTGNPSSSKGPTTTPKTPNFDAGKLSVPEKLKEQKKASNPTVQMIAKITKRLEEDDPPYVYDLPVDYDQVFIQILKSADTEGSCTYSTTDPQQWFSYDSLGGTLLQSPTFMSSIGGVNVPQVKVTSDVFPLEGSAEFIDDGKFILTLAVSRSTKFPDDDPTKTKVGNVTGSGTFSGEGFSGTGVFTGQGNIDEDGTISGTGDFTGTDESGRLFKGSGEFTGNSSDGLQAPIVFGGNGSIVETGETGTFGDDTVSGGSGDDSGNATFERGTEDLNGTCTFIKTGNAPLPEVFGTGSFTVNKNYKEEHPSLADITANGTGEVTSSTDPFVPVGTKVDFSLKIDEGFATYSGSNFQSDFARASYTTTTGTKMHVEQVHLSGSLVPGNEAQPNFRFGNPGLTPPPPGGNPAPPSGGTGATGRTASNVGQGKGVGAGTKGKNALDTLFDQGKKQAKDKAKKALLAPGGPDSYRFIKTYEGTINCYFYGVIPVPGMRGGATAGDVTVGGIIESISLTYPGTLTLQVANYIRANFITNKG